jgi:hypothetical protein
MLGARMKRKLLVALTLKILLHLANRVAKRRPRRAECPATLRANPPYIRSGLNAYHLSHWWHLVGAPPSFFRGSPGTCRSNKETNAGDLSGFFSRAAARRRIVFTTSIDTCSKCFSLIRIATSLSPAET